MEKKRVNKKTLWISIVGVVFTILIVTVIAVPIIMQNQILKLERENKSKQNQIDYLKSQIEEEYFHKTLEYQVFQLGRNSNLTFTQWEESLKEKLPNDKKRLNLIYFFLEGRYTKKTFVEIKTKLEKDNNQ